ncbi:hydantoinase/oxoprolinase family protein [Methanotorris igneus]|uniref:5-oxoprolinase (ATP-hydrolyzing) n=1 Tax=Methanotorris igneus (strain DSM 5666 / JCM 11834 / Kol 5) TaxID=880724 RepID=F6BBN4_METIK|nr:hydantoinase/oxoprolinase family protein [Methanotorris igneus]AEF96043.1 5-oxoprolinase (ATP-hydrolyzing) [Methanotorris igneus Kol 5]
MGRYRVGIDIGGTFTDLVYFDEDSKEFHITKVPTTPKSPAIGAINAIKEAKINFNEIDILVHATTLGTNMFLGQEHLLPPKIALITTKGFRDVIEIGRQRRPKLYDLFFEKPKPLIKRRDRYEVEERIGANGEIITPLNEEELCKIAKEIKNKGYEVVVISFLHSYKNPIHEKKAKEIIRKLYPDVDVITSHEIDPEYKEYERTSTTVVNAYLKPLMSKYLKNLITSLRNEGFNGKFYIMQSNGGVSNIKYATERPAAFIESGPAAGAIAVAYYSKILGDEKVIGFDMGGTTAKASTIINHAPLITNEYEVGGEVHAGRLVKGSGYPVRFPFIDLAEVSAGGGTIAWIDEGNALRVGPISAGADPGPVCYGKGNDKPTITDANLILGRLGDKLSGGALTLRKDLAEKAISKLSEKIGESIEDVALGIIRLANTIMAKALRIVTVERGYDPRDFVMYVFGGAGPLHGVELAEEMEIKSILIPPSCGVFSALGLLLSDCRVDKVKSILKDADEVDEEEVENIFVELIEEGIKEVDGFEEIKIIKQIDVRYKGQSYDITIPWTGNLEEVINNFHKKHEAIYKFSSLDENVEFVNARVTIVGLLTKPEIKYNEIKEYVPKPKCYRKVYFSNGWEETPIYNRDKLRPGATFEGPAIVEEYDSTIVIPPNYHAIVDGYGSIRIERNYSIKEKI